MSSLFDSDISFCGPVLLRLYLCISFKTWQDIFEACRRLQVLQMISFSVTPGKPARTGRPLPVLIMLVIPSSGFDYWIQPTLYIWGSLTRKMGVILSHHIPLGVTWTCFKGFFSLTSLIATCFKLSEVISESNLILRVLGVFWVFLVLKHVQDHLFRISNHWWN